MKWSDSVSEVTSPTTAELCVIRTALQYILNCRQTNGYWQFIPVLDLRHSSGAKGHLFRIVFPLDGASVSLGCRLRLLGVVVLCMSPWRRESRLRRSQCIAVPGGFYYYANEIKRIVRHLYLGSVSASLFRRMDYAASSSPRRLCL